MGTLKGAGRLNIVILQPEIPAYRLDFFRRLAQALGPALRVMHSPGTLGGLSAPVNEDWAVLVGPRRVYPGRFEWQAGVTGLRLQRGDILVLSGNPRQLSTLVLMARVRFYGARIVWWGHYWSATSRPGRQRLRMRLAQLADALLFYTDAEVARFEADGWRHPGLVGALNNGIDITQVRALRSAYDRSKRGRNLVFIGRLSEKANLRLALDALAKPSLRNVHLHVIGDGPEKVNLHARAVKLGVGDQITWHGSTTNEVRIAQITNKCAIFLYPGQVGLSLIHAMSYGLPCIIHDQPLRHMPEIAAFEAERTGFTFTQGDAEDLARVVSRALSCPDRLHSMSENCIRITSNCYNTEHMAERFIGIIDSIRQFDRT
ncbi:MAG: glycosyltransferase family 4 protein [Pseudomonadota bacterium]